MTYTYILKNQHNHFLLKSGEWAPPKNNDRSLFNTQHKDEAINTKIEISVKDADIRVTIVEAQLNDKKAPIIDEKYFADITAHESDSVIHTDDTHSA